MGARHSRLDVDTICSLLGHEYRRRILRYLDTGGLMTTDELAQQLRGDIQEPGGTEMVRVYLFHTHLPKLADAGVIQYVDDSEMVAITRTGRQLLSYLDELETDSASRTVRV